VVQVLCIVHKVDVFWREHCSVDVSEWSCILTDNMQHLQYIKFG